MSELLLFKSHCCSSFGRNLLRWNIYEVLQKGAKSQEKKIFWDKKKKKLQSHNLSVLNTARWESPIPIHIKNKDMKDSKGVIYLNIRWHRWANLNKKK